MRYYYAYIGRDSYLTVSPYHGEANRQQLQRRVKREIGTYQATDIQHARNIALTLQGIGVPR